MRRNFRNLCGYLIGCGAPLLAVGSRAAEPEYSPDVTEWQEVRVPTADRNSDRAAWGFAAGYSELSWRVYLDNARPYAKLINRPNDDSPDPAPFNARADKFRDAKRFREVDDGWLVAFNHGEFGAALYWFDRSGQRHYRISNDQVVAFFSLSDGIYAIEGLAHMGASCGSVIRIKRPKNGPRWQATRFVRLPFAPSTVAVRRDDSMVITLSDSLVSVGPDRQIRTLIADAPWKGLYPSSSILLPDESRLYIGMRQFVSEADLTTNQLRLLVPSMNLLNALPEDQERRIRQQYSGRMADWKPPADLCAQHEKARRRNDR